MIMLEKTLKIPWIFPFSWLSGCFSPSQNGYPLWTLPKNCFWCGQYVDNHFGGVCMFMVFFLLRFLLRGCFWASHSAHHVLFCSSSSRAYIRHSKCGNTADFSKCCFAPPSMRNLEGRAHGTLIFMQLRYWELLPFLKIQRQRRIKFRVLRAQDLYTPLALICQKGQHLPAPEVYKNQSPCSVNYYCFFCLDFSQSLETFFNSTYRGDKTGSVCHFVFSLVLQCLGVPRYQDAWKNSTKKVKRMTNRPHFAHIHNTYEGRKKNYKLKLFGWIFPRRP